MLLPATRASYWQAKFEANKRRDAHSRSELQRMGWQVLVIWECQIQPANMQTLARQVVAFLES